MKINETRCNCQELYDMLVLAHARIESIVGYRNYRNDQNLRTDELLRRIEHAIAKAEGSIE